MRKALSPQLRQCERLLALEKKLPAVLQGEAKPADAAERLDLAVACQYKRSYAAAARLYAAAFAAEPRLAEQFGLGHRFHAACSASQAGCGRGKDAAKLDEEERARWRRQARAWLRAELALHASRLRRENPADRREVRMRLQRWLTDPLLAGVRGAEALGRLPAGERPGWGELWAEAQALRKKLQERGK
jgi:hypothetical protein